MRPGALRISIPKRHGHRETRKAKLPVRRVPEHNVLVAPAPNTRGALVASPSERRWNYVHMRRPREATSQSNTAARVANQIPEFLPTKYLPCRPAAVCRV